MPDAYVCVHAHFYQPPRENPWLGAIEPEPSAGPFHDWNERITAECYGPNAAARVPDESGCVLAARNNYESISFNFGPTLLGWLKDHAPGAYGAVRDADRRSCRRFGGHGSALAQPYNHMIMPLATARDRRTQVVWGIADFRFHFGRDPEGMWLPETAVDVDTLETLAERDIRFTILAPHQAARVRPCGAGSWEDPGSDGVDTTMAYRQLLPSGRFIDLFFYDGSLSKAVAFEDLLEDGSTLADRLAAAALARDRRGARLAHIATDGETYGHHHRHGERALALALQRLTADPRVRLTNYGQFLSLHPPDHEVEIRAKTSWSCAHGLERWRSNCGCNTGEHAAWDQAWREPLREALDFLSGHLAGVFEERGEGLLDDPWAARDDSIDLVLDASDERRRRFLEQHARSGLDQRGRQQALVLLEMQRYAQLMFTSCGWFFDDLGGLEARQVLRYAARALELAESVGDTGGREPFLSRLARSRSNRPGNPDGRSILETEVTVGRREWS